MSLSLFPDISPTLLALTLAVVTGGILLLLLGLALNNPLLLRMGCAIWYAGQAKRFCCSAALRWPRR